MVTVNFNVKESKTDKKGLCTVLMTLNGNGQRTVISTGIKVGRFDRTMQTTGDTKTDDALATLRGTVYRIESDLISKGKCADINEIKRIFQEGGETEKTLLDMFDELVESYRLKWMKGLLSVNCYYKCRHNRKDLTDYIKLKYNRNDMRLTDVDRSFCQGFLEYMEGIKSHNSAVKETMYLKTLVLNLFNDGIIPSNPFHNVRMRQDYSDVKFLTEDEVQRIWNTPMAEERLERVRDCFIFSCYTGLAYIDVKYINRNSVKDDGQGGYIIQIKRHKTDVRAVIPVLDIPLQILTKYNFVLPVPSNQKYNQYIKEVGVICGIDKPLHSHIARHSCACLLLNHKVSIETVSKFLGHSNITMTQHYAKLLVSTMVDEVRKSGL
jgi:site-specific recombinase XerD